MKRFDNNSARVVLKEGRNKSILNRHPWVFSGAIAKIEGEFEPGDILSVFDSKGVFRGKGFVNPNSQIRVRMLTFNDRPIDELFFRGRMEQATSHRLTFFDENTTAYRVINSDGDHLPGLIVDRYGNTLVVQFHALGTARCKSELIHILTDLLQPSTIIESSDSRAIREEGLEPVHEVLLGEGTSPVRIRENGILFNVDVLKGQKTGFFLDQRDNRQLIGELSAGKQLLNCYGYTGGFSVYAALQRAMTTTVDISEPALAMAKENFILNELHPDDHIFSKANVFEYLRELNENYDVIVLDPPAFVKHKKNVNQGARAYKDINRLAIQKVVDGGIVLSCSCSPFIDWDLFQKILFSAAQEAGRRVQIIARTGQPADHPINIYHREGEYLKSFVLRVFD